MAASRPTAAHLAHVAALEEQRQPRQSKAVRALPSTSRLTMATAAHKANKEALLAQQGQIRDENDPFWEQRGDKASSYKGKTFDMSHVKGAPRAFTASAIMNQRQRVLCGKEKLEYERQIIEEGNRKRKQRDQARQRKEEEEGINQAPPDPVIVPAPAPSPALAPAPAPARRVSLIPTPNRGPAQRRLDRSTALDHNPSTNPSLLPLSAQHEQDEEEDEARSLPQAQGQAPEGGDGGEYLLPSQVVEDIEREIRGFYLSPTPRSAPAPFMLASPSSSPGPHEQREEQREDGSCWSPASPTRPRSLPLPQPQPQPEGAQEGDGEALGVFIAFSSSSSSSSSCSSSFVAAATPEHPSRTPPPEPPLRQPGLTPSAPGSGRTRTPTSVTHKRASPRSSNSSRTRAKRAADDDRYFVSANASLGKAVDSRP